MYDTKLRSSFGHSTLVPSFGRYIAYAPFSADLLVVRSTPEVYRWVPNPAAKPGKQVDVQYVAWGLFSDSSFCILTVFFAPGRLALALTWHMLASLQTCWLSDLLQKCIGGSQVNPHLYDWSDTTHIQMSEKPGISAVSSRSSQLQAVLVDKTAVHYAWCVLALIIM